MLPGILVRPLRKQPDDRGFFGEIMRADWKDLLGDDKIAQANLSISYPGMIRGWHRHERGQVDYFIAIEGAVKVCAFDEKSGELDEVISSGQNLQAVRVPGYYWHGFKVIGPERALLVYVVNNLYDPKNPDELRRPWDDPKVVPASINGNANDPRAGKPWDWNYPPHK